MVHRLKSGHRKSSGLLYKMTRAIKSKTWKRQGLFFHVFDCNINMDGIFSIIKGNRWIFFHLSTLYADRELRFAPHTSRSAYRRLLSFALTHLTGSAHAPPIKCVRADCDSQHGKKIKRHFLPMPSILAAQQPPLAIKILEGSHEF